MARFRHITLCSWLGILNPSGCSMYSSSSNSPYKKAVLTSSLEMCQLFNAASSVALARADVFCEILNKIAKIMKIFVKVDLPPPQLHGSLLALSNLIGSFLSYLTEKKVVQWLSI